MQHYSDDGAYAELNFSAKKHVSFDEFISFIENINEKLEKEAEDIVLEFIKKSRGFNRVIPNGFGFEVQNLKIHPKS